ncbi:MAG TPA: carbohydrate kinase family protein [Phycisphaerales bacterium]|nr:carbohydrate kinase family protein [Phycisphaerales bacterium]
MKLKGNREKKKAADILILNTAVVDFRRADFEFAEKLVGKGGLAKCANENMPDYSQEQLRRWIEQGFATVGGPGNAAPLIARTGLKVAVGVNFGGGDYDGLDAQGGFFYDVMSANGIDMSETHIHPDLATGTTYIHDAPGRDRGGIAYFANANDDFDFEIFKEAVERLKPSIVYYMYSGLSERGDADEGRDLAEYIKWCRSKGAVTIVDSHTLTAAPQELINSGESVAEYRLLEPLLPEVDLFFTSSDEAKMIANTLAGKRAWNEFSEHENNLYFLDFLSKRFWRKESGTRMFGVTVSNGAYEKHICPDGAVDGPNKIESRFMAGEVVDLVGAGDSFRSGLLTYIAHNLPCFKAGAVNFAEAVQMGNLFAALYIKAPLDDRYGGIKTYDRMLEVVRSDTTYPTFEALTKALS